MCCKDQYFSFLYFVDEFIKQIKRRERKREREFLTLRGSSLTHYITLLLEHADDEH